MAMNAGQVSVGLSLDDREFTVGLRMATENLDRLASSGMRLATVLTGAFTTIGFKLRGFTNEIMAVGGAFEGAMTRVAAVSGASNEELALLTAKARELGATLPISAREAAEALGILASMGYDAQKMISTVGDVVNLAIGQGYGVAESAALVSSTLANFNLKAEDAARVVNVFTLASNRSALSVQKLAGAMVYAASPAAAMGMSVEELTAMMTAMADAGMQGEMIGTTIRNISMKIASANEVMGVSTRDAAGNMRSMMDVMRDISQTGAGFADFAETFKARGANGALILSQNIDKIAEKYEMLTRVSNEASEQVEKQTQTWGNVVKSFESRVESLYLTIYEQINQTAKENKNLFTGMVMSIEEWVKETGVAKQALDAFMEGLQAGFDFEIPEGGLKEWLFSLNLEDITEQFKSFGQGVSGVANAITGLASAVPWELLANNLDLIAKAAFWAFIIGRGYNIVQTLLEIGVSMGTMARGTVAALSTTTAVTVTNTAATTANTMAQDLATAAAQARAQAVQQAAAAKEASQRAAIATAEAARLATQAQILEEYRFVDALNAQTLALEANRAATLANIAAKQQEALAETANAVAANAEQAAFAAAHGTIKSNLKVTSEHVTGLSKVTAKLGDTLVNLATNPMVWLTTVGPLIYNIGKQIFNDINRPAEEAEKRAKKAAEALFDLKSAIDKVQSGEKNSSEYATGKLKEMTNALIDQKFEALDPAQQQRVVDGLEKMGARAGGRYAKALAERLKGGVENAAEDALAAIKPVTDDDIAKAVSGARAREKIEEGNPEVLKAVRTRFELEDKALAQHNARMKKQYEEANEWRKRAGLELIGPKEYQQEENPEDVMKGLGVFNKVVQEATGAGTEAATGFTGSFQNTLAANPITIPPVQPPNIDTGLMLQNFQAQAPQITEALSRSFSGLKLPPSAMDGLFNGIIESVNAGADSISLALSTALSAINLTPAGITVAETFTDGLLSGFESSDFVSRLYEKIMAKFGKDVAAAGGAK